MLMVATVLPPIRRSPATVDLMVIVLIIGLSLTLLLVGKGPIGELMGRDADFNGRTQVWDLVTSVVSNTFFGEGFENFWYGPRLEHMRIVSPNVNEAHNGFLEVYLNLGLIGTGLICLLLIHSYWISSVAVRRDPVLGGLLRAFVVAASFYSISEAGFRMLSPMWFILLLSSVAAWRVIPLAMPQQSGSERLRAVRVRANGRRLIEPNPIRVPGGLFRENRSNSRSHSPYS